MKNKKLWQVAQSGHTLPILSPSKQLIGSGVNKTLAFMISDDFAFKAKKDGRIDKIDKENKLVFLQYIDGTRDAIDLGVVLDKNSNMGFYIHQEFKLVYKEGEAFKAGDVIAYNPSYFEGKGKNIDYCPGTLAKVAIASGDFAFEDSTMICESLGKRCSAKINELKQVALGKNAVIKKLIKIGDHIDTGDVILEYMNSFDDPDTAEFLQSLGKELSDEQLESITNDTVKTKYPGEVTNLEIYYNCPFEELSPSLQSVIKKYKATRTSRMNAMAGIQGGNVKIPPLEQVDSKKVGKKEFPDDGGVIINIWVEYIDEMGMGDKLTYSTALKGVISRVLTKDEAPLSEYRQEDPVEAILTPTGIISRMTSDIYSMCFGNKVLVELGKQIREIWKGNR